MSRQGYFRMSRHVKRFGGAGFSLWPFVQATVLVPGTVDLARTKGHRLKPAPPYSRPDRSCERIFWTVSDSSRGNCKTERSKKRFIAIRPSFNFVSVARASQE